MPGYASIEWYLNKIAGLLEGVIAMPGNASAEYSLNRIYEILQSGISSGLITSGSATDGQVLTADGSGGAAFEDAAGGGASFAYDGATIVMPEEVNGEGNIEFTYELTLNDTPITTNAWAMLMCVKDGEAFTVGVMDSLSTSQAFIPINSGGSGRLYIKYYEHDLAPNSAIIISENNAGEYQVGVFLPNGGIVLSEIFTIEAPPPP